MVGWFESFLISIVLWGLFFTVHAILFRGVQAFRIPKSNFMRPVPRFARLSKLKPGLTTLNGNEIFLVATGLFVTVVIGPLVRTFLNDANTTAIGFLIFLLTMTLFIFRFIIDWESSSRNS